MDLKPSILADDIRRRRWNDVFENICCMKKTNQIWLKVFHTDAICLFTCKFPLFRQCNWIAGPSELFLEMFQYKCVVLVQPHRDVANSSNSISNTRTQRMQYQLKQPKMSITFSIQTLLSKIELFSKNSTNQTKSEGHLIRSSTIALLIAWINGLWMQSYRQINNTYQIRTQTIRQFQRLFVSDLNAWILWFGFLSNSIHSHGILLRLKCIRVWAVNLKLFGQSVPDCDTAWMRWWSMIHQFLGSLLIINSISKLCMSTIQAIKINTSSKFKKCWRNFITYYVIRSINHELTQTH